MDAAVPPRSSVRTEVVAPPAPAGPRVRLVVVVGTAAGRSIEVPAPRFLVGRDPSCDLRPNNPAISRKHAAIEQRGGRVYVRDLGSSNGTGLNDRLLRDQEAEVRHGDRLQIGPLLFSVVVESEDVADLSRSAEIRARQALEDGVDALDPPTAMILPTVKPAEPPAPKVDPSIGRPHLEWAADRGVLVITLLVHELDDESTVGPVRFALTALFDQPLPKRVILNLGQVGWISARGAGMLLAHAQRLERAGGALRLCAAGDEAAGALEQHMLSRPLATFATVEDAMAAPWK